jgi:TolA-binding protein
MRAFVTCIMALGLVAMPSTAAVRGAGDDTTPAPKTADAAATKTKTADNSAAPSKTDTTTKPENSALESELQQLRDLLEAQSKQLQTQGEQLKEQQLKMQSLEEQLNTTSASRSASAAAPSSSLGEPISIPAAGAIATAGISTNEGAAPAAASAQGSMADEPSALHFKGITITPGGFMAAETVYRSKALSADVNTPFNSTPFPGASNSNLSEFNASGRQSRISMLAEGKLANVKIGGYYETDFLSAGDSSNNNQSNSYTMRQRQFWAQAAFDNGWKFTGGQMWSLLTETTKGLDNRTEVPPMTIDSAYNVGFTWARQYGFRVTKDFGDKFWVGMSVEGPQTTFTVHGNPTQSVTTGQTTVLVPCTTSGATGCTALVGGTTTVFTNFLLGATGASGGVYNPLGNYSYNAAPDLVFKAAWEPGFGHYEIFGVVSRFRDRVFPCEIGAVTTPATACTADAAVNIPSAGGAFDDSRTGGGAGANARWALFAKHIDFGVHFFGGSGTGRYGAGGLSDATIRPDGTIALIRNYQGLGTLQFHLGPKLDVYLNGGAEFNARAQYIKSGTTPNEGYGAVGFNNSGCWTETGPTTTVPVGTTGSQGYIPGGLSNCTGDSRSLIEGTGGFWYRFYKGPKGTIQFGGQYSYLVRNTWSGVGGSTAPSITGQPQGTNNLFFTSFRYYLP